ncbi:MAG: hypothetical protein M3248_06145 [Actinomycetota bacterium]|nr:hypothetical protein [Actinomycetota bacterium]
MESVESYFERKWQEIKLIDSYLAAPCASVRPRTVEEVVEQKFRVAAILKAERALAAWTATETHWTDVPSFRTGPFEIGYGYQRADLTVRGPLPYGALRSRADGDVVRAIYTSSGMAAVSALLMALGRTAETVGLLVVPGTYKETLEVVDAYARNFHLVPIDCRRGLPVEQRRIPRERRALLVDSCVPEHVFRPEAVGPGSLDLIIFDTTCFSADSGRIRRVLCWAHKVGLPVALVRSHTKLDSLGIEFGRLGSAVFLASEHTLPAARRHWFQELARETQEAVRLLGGAAVPAHFCPFIGSDAYRRLSAKRIAAIIHNARYLRRNLGPALHGHCGFTPYQHGLFATFSSSTAWEEGEAKRWAEHLASDLRRKGLPVRHAGSFGFDFVATEAFFDTAIGRHVLRVSVADLPPPIFGRIVERIGTWWTARRRDQLGSLPRTEGTSSGKAA